MRVTSKTARSRNLKAKIQLQIFLQSGSLRISEYAQNHFPAFLPIDHSFAAGLYLSPDSHQGLQISTEVNIGRPRSYGRIE